MKKIYLYTLLLFSAWAFSSCGKSDAIDSESIFDTSEVQRNEFDTWILNNYTRPYNIDLKYRMEDIESSLGYNLVPAEYEKAVKLAHIVKYVWLEAYDEVAGIDFTKQYVPKVIHLIGSAAYNSNNTMVLGTAEGGMKVTLYLVNSLQINAALLNTYYFKTMHHEFGHILNQKIAYDPDFQTISEADYIGGNWYQYSTTQAHQKGFVTPYSMSEPGEDFVENVALYVTNTPEYWAALLKDAGTGATKINAKFEIVYNYMKNSWGIDLNTLRDVVLRREGDLPTLDLTTLK